MGTLPLAGWAEVAAEEAVWAEEGCEEAEAADVSVGLLDGVVSTEVRVDTAIVVVCAAAFVVAVVVAGWLISSEGSINSVPPSSETSSEDSAGRLCSAELSEAVSEEGTLPVALELGDDEVFGRAVVFWETFTVDVG